MNKSHYSVNGWLLDRNASAIVHISSGQIKRLGEYQFKLLACLVEHAGQPLSRNELTALVWHRRVIGDNSLSNAIHALRVALEDDGKQQRVIKTIPKKGYVLEAEFCAMVEAPAAEVPDAPQETPAASAVLPSSPPVEQSAPVDPPPNLLSKSGWRTIPRRLIAAVLVGILLLGGGWLYAWHIADSDIIYKEQVKNRWSNIRVFRLAVASDDINDEEIMKIKAALDKLNQRLIGLDTGMAIYYRTTEQMLNYTFTLTSACNSRQLAMTLYHWRIDSQKLSDVIYRETERKIDEMAPCKKP